MPDVEYLLVILLQRYLFHSREVTYLADLAQNVESKMPDVEYLLVILLQRYFFYPRDEYAVFNTNVGYAQREINPSSNLK